MGAEDGARECSLLAESCQVNSGGALWICGDCNPLPLGSTQPKEEGGSAAGSSELLTRSPLPTPPSTHLPVGRWGRRVQGHKASRSERKQPVMARCPRGMRTGESRSCLRGAEGATWRGWQHQSPLQGTDHPTAQLLPLAGSSRSGRRGLSQRAVGLRKKRYHRNSGLRLPAR